MTYFVTDRSEHGDIHRGFTAVDDGELNITITHEGVIIDLYDDEAGELVGTIANTFDEIAEIMMAKAHPTDWERIKAWEASLPEPTEEEMQATASAFTEYLAGAETEKEE